MITRQRVFAFGAILTLTVSLTGFANAQTLTQDSGFIPANSNTAGNPPTVIPDFVPGLSNNANTVFSTVTISASDVAFIDNGGNISDVFITLEGLTHSHLSDLTVSVLHTNSGRMATLFERVGIEDDGTDVGDNGIVDNQNGDGIGDSSNLSGTYRFQDDGDSLFQVAAATGDAVFIPTLNSQGAGLPVYAASGANNGQVSLLTQLATDGAGNALTLPQIVGTYQFAISDRSNQTTNVDAPGNSAVGFQSFTQTNIAFQAAAPGAAIPEPGTATALLLGIVGLAARRRKA